MKKVISIVFMIFLLFVVIGTSGYSKALKAPSNVLGDPTVELSKKVPSKRPQIFFTYVPPYGNWTDKLQGQVLNVNPADFKVAVYIYLPHLSKYPHAKGWWTKPYWDFPLTPINADGTWSCSICTGGVDEYATNIVAYLVPNGYNPPSLAGASKLPSGLNKKSVAKAKVTRKP